MRCFSVAMLFFPAITMAQGLHISGSVEANLRAILRQDIETVMQGGNGLLSDVFGGPIKQVHADMVYREYEENQARADAEFPEDKPLVIAGMVDGVRKDGNVYIAEMLGINARFSHTSTTYIQRLRLGDQVKLFCYPTGQMDYNTKMPAMVPLFDCSDVEEQTSSLANAATSSISKTVGSGGKLTKTAAIALLTAMSVDEASADGKHSCDVIASDECSSFLHSAALRPYVDRSVKTLLDHGVSIDKEVGP